MLLVAANTINRKQFLATTTVVGLVEGACRGEEERSIASMKIFEINSPSLLPNKPLRNARGYVEGLLDHRLIPFALISSSCKILNMAGDFSSKRIAVLRNREEFIGILQGMDIGVTPRDSQSC